MNTERGEKMFYKAFLQIFVVVFTWSSTLAPASITLATSAQAVGPNLIVNGDFESGNTGFTSDYVFSPGNIQAGATYDLTSNPTNSHPAATTFGDHTSGVGQMMAINGATSAGLVVWAQSVQVTANTDYEFSGWVASWYFISPAQLQFSINGSPVGTFTASSTSGLWQQFTVVWNSGASTSANIEIIDLNTEDNGNDFSLDDLALHSLGACNAPTETPTETPTGTPTGTPTETPTGTPTETPTGTPTGTPTETPTGTCGIFRAIYL